ncbi:type 3 dihydrofolate reductase [Paraneptunicella aestuarii]|uniref:type 3 dihydrofolate reductase n=1 Tax=Paraneptunicella aestuarii TaxID=2831148 RepID=UPI001E547073|nr:type 3 dihydrofolate reductase [Paraneptunicella aestuarii]UAA38185.1 type 3 dihydrofolate reductase [Paraneptunicella aestuarii]
MSKISLIAAMADRRVIGADNAMPWHLPADLKHFKQVTMGKPVIMGRKTYQSIGKALPGRQNIVISASGFDASDADVVTTPEQALELVSGIEEVMIIGGGKIYEMFLPQADTLYLTFIDLEVQGDTQFPDYESHCEWSEVESEAFQADDKNPYSYRFVTLKRM